MTRNGALTSTRTRCLWWIKLCHYGLFNHLGSCWNIQFQISSRRKTGEETLKSSKLELLEKVLANKFALTDAEDNTSGLLNRRNTADLSLLRILLAIQQKSWEPSFWEVMDSFTMITSLFELYFIFIRFMLLVQTKKWFLWTMTAAQAAENHSDEWSLTWYLRWGIYT